MITGRRMVRLSERGERALFAGYRRIDVARNPAMAARRIAGVRGGYDTRRIYAARGRAYQALNGMGRRIWVDKPRLFGGYKWRERQATIAQFVELRDFRESREWQRSGLPAFSTRRNLHIGNVDVCTVTGGSGFVTWEGSGYSLDAPDFIAGGCCWWFDPWPFGLPYATQLYLWRGQS